MEIGFVADVRVVKKATDPECPTRVSMGGSIDDGYYCTYRGTKEDAILCIKAALRAMEGMAEFVESHGAKEPDVEPDDGKKYA